MKTLPLASIRVDGDTQARVEIDADTVEEYAERMGAGLAFPPLSVFSDGERYWLVDGFHRLHAARKAGLTEFACEVQAGTLDEARWHALTTNASHGKRRTNADKRHYVERALDRKSELSDRAIAEHVGVSHPFVARVRRDMTTGNGYQSTARVGLDGRTVQTANIGKPGRNTSWEDASAGKLRGIIPRLAADIREAGRLLLEARAALTPEQFRDWAWAEGFGEEEAEGAVAAYEHFGDGPLDLAGSCAALQLYSESNV